MSGQSTDPLDRDDELVVKTQEAKSKERRQTRQDLEDMKYVLSSAQGRRCLWHLLKFCGLADSGVFKLSAHNSGSWSYYNEGQRSVGNATVEAIMEADQEAWFKMVRENKNKEKLNV